MSPAAAGLNAAERKARAAEPPRIKGIGRLSLGALGIVFGDIGTSPLYTLRACLSARDAPAFSSADVLGVLSLIFWTLTLVVSFKYVTIIMRADNHGEGGIFALLALLPERPRRTTGGVVGMVALLVIAGAALLYGDGMITPAISVLSAVEGLEVAAPWLKPAVLPITCLILVLLFAFQHRGTGGLGRVFGPIMAVWFIVIGALGAGPNRPPSRRCWRRWGRNMPRATSPRTASRSLFVLGSVVLAVTGAEALYADMGHFGAAPIRAGVVRAGHAGAGAQLPRPGGAASCGTPPPFRIPSLRWPPPAARPTRSIGLSTAATVIASQALISGAFSLTNQAMQLGFLPPVTVVHTSSDEEGQVYVPEVNLAPRRRLSRSGPDLPSFEPVGFGVWHRRHRHDGPHVDHLLRGRAHHLAVAVLEGDARC